MLDTIVTKSPIVGMGCLFWNCWLVGSHKPLKIIDFSYHPWLFSMTSHQYSIAKDNTYLISRTQRLSWYLPRSSTPIG